MNSYNYGFHLKKADELVEQKNQLKKKIRDINNNLEKILIEASTSISKEICNSISDKKGLILLYVEYISARAPTIRFLFFNSESKKILSYDVLNGTKMKELDLQTIVYSNLQGFYFDTCRQSVFYVLKEEEGKVFVQRVSSTEFYKILINNIRGQEGKSEESLDKICCEICTILGEGDYRNTRIDIVPWVLKRCIEKTCKNIQKELEKIWIVKLPIPLVIEYID